MAFMSLSGRSDHAAFSGTLKFVGTNLGGGIATTLQDQAEETEEEI